MPDISPLQLESDPEVIRALIAFGADINALDQRGYSPNDGPCFFCEDKARGNLYPLSRPVTVQALPL